MNHDWIVVLQSRTDHGSHPPPKLQYGVRERASVARPFRVMELQQSPGLLISLPNEIVVKIRMSVTSVVVNRRTSEDFAGEGGGFASHQTRRGGTNPH